MFYFAIEKLQYKKCTKQMYRFYEELFIELYLHRVLNVWLFKTESVEGKTINARIKRVKVKLL